MSTFLSYSIFIRLLFISGSALQNDLSCVRFFRVFTSFDSIWFRFCFYLSLSFSSFCFATIYIFIFFILYCSRYFFSCCTVKFCLEVCDNRKENVSISKRSKSLILPIECFFFCFCFLVFTSSFARAEHI